MRFKMSYGLAYLPDALKLKVFKEVGPDFSERDWTFLDGYKHPSHLNIGESIILWGKHSCAYHLIKRVP